jgi:hypothetical protein
LIFSEASERGDKQFFARLVAESGRIGHPMDVKSGFGVV